jgi:hypothetical protein
MPGDGGRHRPAVLFIGTNERNGQDVFLGAILNP